MICCCSIDTCHDESAKIKLLFLNDDDSFGRTVVFPNLREGEIHMVNQNYFGSVNFQSVLLIGQNKLLHGLNKRFFRDKRRVIYLIGEEKSGKTTISKFFANHMQERHKFTNLRYINIHTLGRTDRVNLLKSRLIGYHKVTDADHKILQERSLFILDNMDELIKSHWNAVQQLLTDCIEQTNFSFIITIQSDTMLKILSSFEVTQKIPAFTPQMAAKFINMKADSYLHTREKNIYDLSKTELFTKNRFMASELLQMVDQLKSGKQLKQIESQLLDKSSPMDNQSRPTIEDNGEIRPSEFEDEFLETILR